MLEKYEQILENYLNRLIELDSLPIEERARMTYSVGNLTYSWNEYRSSLIKSIADIQNAMKELANIYPFEYKIRLT